MRNLNIPFKTFERNVKTNQRIYFDLSKDGHWLLSGDSEGYVHVWNLKNDETKRISVSVKMSVSYHVFCCNFFYSFQFIMIVVMECLYIRFIQLLRQVLVNIMDQKTQKLLMIKLEVIQKLNPKTL